MHKKLICSCCIVLVSSLILTSIARAELVGWWRLEEGAGTTVADASSSGNDGTFSGNPQWVAGKVGGGLQFDGGDFVSVPGAANIKPPSLTLMTWVNFNNVSQTATREDYLSRGDDYAFSLHEDNADGKIHGIVTSAGGWSVVDGKTTIEPNRWYHTAMTYDTASKELLLYVDGQQDGSLSVPAGIEHRLGGPLTMGTYSGRDLLGKLDEVQIWDEALSEEQIKAAMLSEGYPYAYGPNPPDGAMHPDTWVSLLWKSGDFAVSHDVYLGESFADVNAGDSSTFRGNQTANTYLAGFVGYAYPDGLVPGTTYYWRIDEVNTAEPNSPWKGPVWSFSIPPRTAYNPRPADGAESAALDAKLSWTAGFGAKLRTVYFGDNFDDVNNATSGGSMTGTTSYSPASLKSAKVYYWRVDEMSPPNTYKGQVWSFTTVGAVGKPHPSNGNTDAEMNAILSWTRATAAASHEVYFGTDKEAVRKATTTSPEYKGVRALGAESYDPGSLARDSAYYWRVDEVNSVNPNSPWKGPLWSFTTGSFLLVDGFEPYNDIDPPSAGSNRIFDKWIDGFGTTTNGAVVGSNLPPYAERTIVHGGAQSMPLSYDNNLKFSEATMALTGVAGDWTREGVASLSLWFRGATTNSAERMYVAINGTAVVYHDNPNAAQATAWTQWVIPLQAFADLGVNLANVTSVTIGLGTRGTTTIAGGTGKMYIDDIRLYQPQTTP